ncbi:hypothetical protein OAD66_04735 [Bacteroidia bacterium]|nr:hypothetical protein [Bacteroidia bacterium]MDB4107260.1 hypothetical protein [Bacteroidia bacterium]MDB9882423.1 hypothetical protein [Bacteroidia bacterium]
MIISDYIIPLRPIDENASPKKCIETMMDNLCYEIPVMRNSKLYGTVDLDECIHTADDTILSIVDPGYASVHFNSHLFDVLRVFNESKRNVISVLAEDFEWLGIVTKTTILEALGNSLTAEQNGAVLLLEMASHQYSTNELSRIVESESCQILGLWLNHLSESGRIRVSLKLNTENAERIVSGLQRHGYEVIAAFGDDDYKENVEKRFESLMKYIDI